MQCSAVECGARSSMRGRMARSLLRAQEATARSRQTPPPRCGRLSLHRAHRPRPPPLPSVCVDSAGPTLAPAASLASPSITRTASMHMSAQQITYQSVDAKSSN